MAAAASLFINKLEVNEALGKEGNGGSWPPFKMHYPRESPPTRLRLTDRVLVSRRVNEDTQRKGR